MEARAKYWLGSPPTKCDVYGTPITDAFVDGATRMGPWGILHPDTHADVGLGLGVGRGQKYQRQDDGRWLKVAG